MACLFIYIYMYIYNSWHVYIYIYMYILYTSCHVYICVSIYIYIYCIPCKNWKLKYIGETSQKILVCLKEHKRDMRIDNLNNALFQHISQSNHNFDFNSAKMLIYIHNKRVRQIFEAALEFPKYSSGLL